MPHNQMEQLQKKTKTEANEKVGTVGDMWKAMIGEESVEEENIKKGCSR